MSRHLVILSSCHLLALSLVLHLASPAGAQPLDPEVNKPYRLQVVVRIAKHRQLTDLFKKQVIRELRDGLQAELRELGEVEVMTEHPNRQLLQAIESQGLQQALDGWKQVSDVKTHFVLIDFNQGQYEIQTLQHDGWTGLASPVLRRQRTTDRFIVARTAALLVNEDLGLVGTLETKPAKAQAEVNLILKGGGLGLPLGLWIKPDDVFAIAQVYRQGKELRSRRVEAALLQVISEPNEQGVCRCRYINRYRVLPSPALAYRCVKLGTTTGIVRFRLHDPKTRKAPNGIQVKISQRGFDVTQQETGFPDNNGVVQSSQVYSHLAYVTIWRGKIKSAEIPVEVLEDRVPFYELPENEEDDLKGQFGLEHDRVLRHLNESVEVLTMQFDQLKKTAGNNEAMAAQAAKIRGDLDDRIKAGTEEVRELRERLRKDKLERSISLKVADQSLERLKGGQLELEKLIKNLEEAARLANDPKRKAVIDLVGEAHRHKFAAEFGQEIETYTKIVAQAKEFDADLSRKAETYLKWLKASWEPKNDAHKQARSNIYKEWPRMDAPKLMQGYLPRVRDAFEVCKKEKDYLTPQKLLAVSLAHVQALSKRNDGLQPDNPDDVEEIKIIGETSQELKKLIEDVGAYVQNAPKPPPT